MKRLVFIVVVFGFFLLSAPVSEVNAQVFKLELANPTQSISVGDTFEVKIFINTSGVEAINGDTLINFDPNYINIESAENGNFFTYFVETPLSGTTNKYLISSWEESIAHAKSTVQDELFAKLSLKASTSGPTSLSFDCTPSTGADTNINRASDSEDIVKCDGLNKLNLNIGSGRSDGSPTSTPVPTATTTPSGPTSTPTLTPTNTPIPTQAPTEAPTNTPQPQISELPRSGIIDSTIGLLSLGIVLTMVGLLAML